MNKKGAEMNLIVKVLLILAGALTIFAGANQLWISLGKESLVRIVTSNSGLAMQILYALMGASSLVTSIVLGVKIFKNRN